MKKIKEIAKKIFTREVTMYLIFGIVTTIVNLVIFKVLSSVFYIEENLSNNIGIVCAFLTAYFTNRKWVFNSAAKGFRERGLEFVKFLSGRLFTMLLEAVGFYILFSVLHINENISKFSMIVIVVILNYFFSKFFAFKKNKD